MEATQTFPCEPIHNFPCEHTEKPEKLPCENVGLLQYAAKRLKTVEDELKTVEDEQRASRLERRSLRMTNDELLQSIANENNRKNQFLRALASAALAYMTPDCPEQQN